VSSNYCLTALALFFMSATAYGQPPDIQIDNSLHQCSDITLVDTTSVGNVVLATVDVKINKITAYCGCKSLVSAYTVYVDSDGSSTFISSGNFTMKNSGRVVFVVSPESSLTTGKKVRIDVSCSEP
jgi:hypothetical protein